MTAAHHVQSVDFDGDWLLLRADDIDYKINLRSQSEKLASADDATKSHFVISPSGYGIHWPDIDEDLSVDGLIKASEGVLPRG